jgi:hypothetical protein
LKLSSDKPLSRFAFNINLRRYTEVEERAAAEIAAVRATGRG